MIKKTLLLLLLSPSTSFSFLLYVSSSSGGKSYSHLKWTEEGRRRGRDNALKTVKRFSAQEKCQFHENWDYFQLKKKKKKK